VRGAFNHTIGIQDQGLIVAINQTGKQIFIQVADLRHCADFSEIVPALTGELIRRKMRFVGAHCIEVLSLRQIPLT